MGKHKTGLRHTDTLNCLKTGGGERKSAISGETNVFGGENNHAASNKFGILAGFDHASEVVKCSIDVGTTHGFNEG